MNEVLMALSPNNDMSISYQYFDILGERVDIADISCSKYLSNGSSSTYHNGSFITQLNEQLDEPDEPKDLEEKIVKKLEVLGYGR